MSVSLFHCARCVVLVICSLIEGVSLCAEEPYFAIRVSDKTPGIPMWAAESYASILASFGEPPLPFLKSRPNIVVCRLMIAPAFGSTFCVRIQQEGKQFRLWSKRSDTTKAGKLAEQKELLLSESVSETICKAFETLHFFKMVSDDKPLGADGHGWLLEGVQAGQYNVVLHWAVTVDTETRGLTSYYEFCKILIKHDGLTETPKNAGHEIIH